VTSTSLSPSDLGLPPKFSTWRPGQWDAVESTMTLFQKFIAQSAPTGFGKSPYAIACALLDGSRTVVTTSTKALQKQYIDDFLSCGLFSIQGRQNYPCAEYYDCSQGRLQGCEQKDQCPASAARVKYLGSKLSVTNYALLLANAIHGEGNGPIGLLILDEAHTAIQELSDAIEIHLKHAVYESLYNYFNAYPDFSTLDQYRAWGKALFPGILKYKELIKDGDGKLVALVTSFAQVVERIANVPADWILDLSKQEETVIAPLWPTDYAAKYLFPESVTRVLLVSATIVPKTLQLLGISEHDSVFLSQPHTFDPTRSPVYLYGPHKVNAQNSAAENQIWLGRLDTILRRRQDRKGIIHTTSYDRQQFIVQHSEHSANMIAPRNPRELAGELAKFRAAGPGAVLVSPSVTTGYDFPGDQCEYQILCKMPFIDTRGPIMTARCEADKEYTPYLMAQTIVQTCGRGTRFDGDRCENFILDANANWFFRKKEKRGFRHLFPPWFIKQVQYPETLPAPPPAL
jgi:ATP-dependent DNA helicase DinG